MLVDVGSFFDSPVPIYLWHTPDAAIDRRKPLINLKKLAGLGIEPSCEFAFIRKREYLLRRRGGDYYLNGRLQILMEGRMIK